MALLNISLEKPLTAEPVTRIEDTTYYEENQRLGYASYMFFNLRETSGSNSVPVTVVNRQADSAWEFVSLDSGHYKAELVLIPVWSKAILEGGPTTEITKGSVFYHLEKVFKAKNSMPLLIDGLVRNGPDADPNNWEELYNIDSASDLVDPYFIPQNPFETINYASIDFLRFVAIGQEFAKAMLEYKDDCDDCNSDEFKKLLRLRNKHEQVALANNAKAYEKGQQIIESIRKRNLFMLSNDQIKEFKGKLLTKMLQIAEESARKEYLGICTNKLDCDYQYLSLAKDAIFMPNSGLNSDEIETLVYRATSKGRLNEVVPISFTLISDVLFGDSISNELLLGEINKLKSEVTNIYNILDGFGGFGNIGIDSGNAQTVYE